MENNCSVEFVLHEDEANNFIRMDGRMQSFSILREMYGVKDNFCDVKLFGLPPPNAPDADLPPIHAHKCVLARASEHLLKLFKRTDRQQSEYEIGTVDHQSLGRIVECVYTGQITTAITESPMEVMRGVLIGANYLLMKNLANACDTFLAGDQQVKPENCVRLWVYARQYTCLKLLHATSTFIANNLAALANDAEFLRMPYEDCAKLLMSEAFVTANADQRCLAGVAWLKSESVDRAAHVHDILNMIPLVFGSVSIDTVHAALNSEMLWEHAPLIMRKLSVSVTQKLVLAPSSGGGSDSGSSASSWFVIGGASNSFLRYDVDPRMWSVLPKLPWRRRNFGACVIGNRLIAAGGFVNGMLSNAIDEYDMVSKTWSTSTARLSAQSCSEVCTDGQQAYVLLSGKLHFPVDACDTLEMYDWKSKQIVEFAAPSPADMDSFAAAISVATNCIYIVDSDIQKFEISYNKWKNIGQLNQFQEAMAAAVSGDEMYLLGGYLGNGTETDLVEVFNIRTGQFRTEPNLIKARSHCRATTLYNGNVVCVLGGNDDTLEFLSDVEVFDKREGKWSTGKIVPDMPVPDMPVPATRFGFATV